MNSEVLKESSNSYESRMNDFTEGYTEESTAKYLSVIISGDSYCISLNSIAEIIQINRIFQVEEMPRSVRGVINLRGKIIPIIDLKLLFNSGYTESKNWINIIILNIKGNYIGLIVDSIQKIVSLTSEESASLQQFKHLAVIDRNRTQEKKSGILLDAEKIVESDELYSIKDSIEKYLRPMEK